MSGDLTAAEIHDRIAWLKDRAREGAAALHARAATPERLPKLTDSESAALARKRIENGERP